MSVFDPVLLTLSPEPYDTRWDDFAALGIQMFSLNLSRLTGMFLAKLKLQRFLESMQCNFVHSHGIRPDVLVASLGLDIPKVATVHNFPQMDYKMTFGRSLSVFMVKKHIQAMKHFDRLIGCSVAVENNLKNVFGITNITSIQNGVDQAIFHPKGKGNWRFRSKFNIGETDVVWISTSHLSERKDPFFLIDAWSLIEERFPKHHLVFLGSGALAKECSRRIAELKNVHMVGRVANVVDYLQGSDFFITASHAEGLPMAAIEGMACGLPLLATDIEPYKEIYSLSNEVGMLFKLGSIESFYDAFSRLAAREYSETSKAALSLVSQKLNSKAMSEAYQVLYKELLRIK